MSNLFQVILGSVIGSILALSGGFLLLSNRKFAQKMALYAAPFAAGALLGTVFFDLLPDALMETDNIQTVLTFTLVGLIFFFLLERFMHWFHHQHEANDRHTDTAAPLIIIGDTLHNAIDGVAIGAAFLISPVTGFIASFAVAAHEVPQEVGDFGLLLKFGYSKKRTLLINVLSAFSTTPIAVLVWIVGGHDSFPITQLLGITAGFFIYIAVADLIPRIHSEAKRHLAEIETVILIISIILVALFSSLAHKYIEADHESSEHTKAQTQDTH